ncbi:MAG: glycerate kinase [Clostridia bacterium]|nr:glycerate kinase [Clostridia bacterium]
MKKVVVAMDSFKGSISSEKACSVISEAMRSAIPDLEVITLPIADGGEGTIEVLGAEKKFAVVNDAFFSPIQSYWGKLGHTAVIELATVAGLPMIDTPDPMKTSTFGVGELILDALNQGERDFILALGGSSTNDLGCGIACALGARFYNGAGESFVPTGGTLIDIKRIDLTHLDPRLKQCRFTTMCDVTNPLYGENGAAYVFAPQKGATKETLPKLDAGLKHAANCIEKVLGFEIANIPGAGAAGGCGAGSVAFLNSILKSGIETVLELKEFSKKIEGADLVISGEGRFDSQSAGGKAVSGVASVCSEKNVPMVVLCGSFLPGKAELPKGISAVFSILNRPCTLEEALRDGADNLYQTAFQLASLLNR